MEHALLGIALVKLDTWGRFRSKIKGTENGADSGPTKILSPLAG